MNDLYKTFQKSHLFQGLTHEQIQAVIAVVQPLVFAPGQIIMTQGEVGNELFLITSGAVEVLKNEVAGIFHRVAVLQEGSTVGELSMVDHGVRSATVRALEETHVLRITGDIFQHVIDDPAIGLFTYKNLAVDLGNRLRHTNEVTVAALEKNLSQTKKQVVVGNVMVFMLIILTLFTFSLGVLTQINQAMGTSGYLTIALLVAAALVMMVLVRMNDFPLAFYGVTLENWKKALVESVGWSAVALIVLTFLKILLINFSPKFSQEPLFNFEGVLYHGAAQKDSLFLLSLMYVFISTPLQEFLFRGCFQGALQSFLTGPYGARVAVFTTSLIFAMVHLAISPILSMIAFIGGCFWGNLYKRHNTLVGVIFSHMCVGFWLFFVLGVERMMVGRLS